MTITLDMSKLDRDALLNALASFCRIHGAPRCYQNWSPETLRDYLAFHAQHRTLVWISEPSTLNPQLSTLLGTGVAWQMSEAEIEHRDVTGQHQFNWEPGNVNGDSVFFADFVCCRPDAFIQILNGFAQRFPHWAKLKWFTYRRGKLKRFRIRQARQLMYLSTHSKKGNHVQH